MDTPAVSSLLTISDVVAQLDDVIARCALARSKLGYFAMLYRNVTVRVQQGIVAGRFNDGARLERLDVVFARRYLDAFEQFWRGDAPTASWLVAFRAASDWRFIILQHLLLGINAHINLDLAIAAAETAPGKELPMLKPDFDDITSLLIEMFDDVQQRVERVSPWFRVLDRISGNTEKELGSFGLDISRQRAWQVAQELAVMTPAQRQSAILVHDQLVAQLGRRLYFPTLRLSATHFLVRTREDNDVPRVIETLRL